MFDIIEIIDEIQPLVLRKIIVCKGIADRKPFSKCPYTGNIKRNPVPFFAAHTEIFWSNIRRSQEQNKFICFAEAQQYM